MSRWHPAARLFFAGHALLYRLSGGALGGSFNGPVLLLTTTGRKTGQRRTRPLTYLRDGEDLVVMGSNGGKDVHPAWYWNLRHNPAAEVQIGQQRLRVRAQEATPEERSRLWPRMIAQTPAWSTYTEKTARDVPIIILRPIEDGATGRQAG